MDTIKEKLICCKCKQEKNVSEFAKWTARTRGYQYLCKICRKEDDAKRYKVDKEKIDKRNKAYKDRFSAIIREAKNKPCMDCKIAYPSYVMDFDHIRGKKKFNISRMASEAPNEHEIMEEIAKCDVVCANCHRERTHRRSRSDSSTDRASDFESDGCRFEPYSERK